MRRELHLFQSDTVLWSLLLFQKSFSCGITFCKIQLIHPPYSAGVPQPHKRGSDTFYDLRQGGKEGDGGMWNLEKLCARLEKAAWEETFMEIKPDGVIRLNHCELINVYGWLIERFAAVTSSGPVILPQNERVHKHSLQHNTQPNCSSAWMNSL